MEKDQIPKDSETFSISINYRWAKVRVHKQTITVLGTPRFVQFLINPEDKLLYMRGTNSRDSNCLVVPPEDYRKRNQYVLNGKHFIKKLSGLVGWSLDRTYTIRGDYSPEYNMIVFRLEDAVPGKSSK